jgi:DNA-binding LytR/AlgR family response regulator
VKALRVVLVDDEAPARRRLTRMLEALGGVEIAGEASDADEALERVRELEPDIVFLDVRMPGLDGMSLARSAPELPPIIFTTAFAEHAASAFEVQAVDYLLKPVTRDRLAEAVRRARERVERSWAQLDLGGLAPRLASAGATTAAARVTASARGEVKIFVASEISRFFSTDKYTAFIAGGREYLTEESLNALEARLPGFARVHRAELINLERVRAMRRDAAGLTVELADGQQASVSRRHVAMLKARLGV